MATSGQKPKSTHLKAVTGNPGKRRMPEEPDAGGDIGPPPEDWTDEQRAYWMEIVNRLPAGVAKQSDRFLVELAARNLAQVRASGTISAAQSAEMRRCLGELGMTPSERARVAADGGEETKNPFAALDE